MKNGTRFYIWNQNWNSPKYCDQNLLMLRILRIATNGDTITEIISGPKKVRGTTPGNS